MTYVSCIFLIQAMSNKTDIKRDTACPYKLHKQDHSKRAPRPNTSDIISECSDRIKKNI